MTTRRDISLNVIADISKYQQQFAKVPGFTDKQAAKAAASLEKRMSKAAADSARSAQKATAATVRQAAKAADKIERDAARAVSENQRSAVQAGKGLAELAGIQADKFEKVRDVVAGLASPMGQMALVATGAALAIGAVVVSATAFAAASVSAVRSSAELIDKFEALSSVDGFAIPQTDITSIKQANAALDSIQITADRLVVIFAGKVSPAVHGVAVEVVKLGLAAGDIFDGMGNGAQVVADTFGKLGRIILATITPALSGLMELASIGASVARVGGFDRLADGFASIANSATLIPFKAMELGFEGVSIATEDYTERALELIGVQAKLTEEEKENTGATKENTTAKDRQEAQLKAIIAAGKARNEQVDREIELQRKSAQIVAEATAVELSAMGKLAQATDQQLAKAEEIRRQRIENAGTDRAMELQAEQDFQEARTALENQYEMERTEITRREAEARKAIEEQEAIDAGNNLAKAAQLTLSNTHQLMQGLQTIAADSKSKEQARKLFQASKVTGLGMVAVNTAISITKALADLGPILGPVAATAMAANGVVQAEVIRRQKPPTFYRGTAMVERPDGGAADAVPATLHAGEAVLNRRAAESMGRDQIEAMNAGRRSSGSQVVAISQINHRQFRSFYRDDRSLPGSLTRRDRNRNGTKIGRQL